jgi:hypothetical protein
VPNADNCCSFRLSLQIGATANPGATALTCTFRITGTATDQYIPLYLPTATLPPLTDIIQPQVTLTLERDPPYWLNTNGGYIRASARLDDGTQIGGVPHAGGFITYQLSCSPTVSADGFGIEAPLSLDTRWPLQRAIHQYTVSLLQQICLTAIHMRLSC